MTTDITAILYDLAAVRANVQPQLDSLDAELLAQLYVELQGGRQIGLELAAEAVVEAAGEVVSLVTRRLWRAPRTHAASEAELARHAAFLATIPEAVWNR